MKTSQIVSVARILCLLLVFVSGAAFGQTMPTIKVSENQRHFVDESGSPFFYLGDTAWGLFTLDREDVDHYLQDRSAKGFTVIQAVIGFWRPLDAQNPHGHPMFVDGDASRPNDAFFENVDSVIDRAESMGLRVALVPIWSRDHVHQSHSVLDDRSARSFGRYLGERYKNRSVFWILGGDWTPWGMEELWREMAKGIEEGVGAGVKHLKTFHARAPQSSSIWYHNDDWLDFNMLQTGHSGVVNRNYELLDDDYDLCPIKPVLDGEPAYENIRDRNADSRVSVHAVRQQAYCAVFAGACGHTYGADRVYGFSSGWKEATQLPGAAQMGYLRYLIESRPMLTRIPDQWLIINDPMSIKDRIQACRSSDGSYAMFYTASGRPISVKLRHHGDDWVTGESIRSWWYNPRNGKADLIDVRKREATNDLDRARDDITFEYSPPTSGEGEDWILVIDDASKDFPAPGTRAKRGTGDPSAALDFEIDD